MRYGNDFDGELTRRDSVMEGYGHSSGAYNAGGYDSAAYGTAGYNKAAYNTTVTYDQSGDYPMAGTFPRSDGFRAPTFDDIAGPTERPDVYQEPSFSQMEVQHFPVREHSTTGGVDRAGGWRMSLDEFGRGVRVCALPVCVRC
jgi:hypothetical protein